MLCTPVHMDVECLHGVKILILQFYKYKIKQNTTFLDLVQLTVPNAISLAFVLDNCRYWFEQSVVCLASC